MYEGQLTISHCLAKVFDCAGERFFADCHRTKTGYQERPFNPARDFGTIPVFEIFSILEFHHFGVALLP